jgi:hypothetical protein
LSFTHLKEAKMPENLLLLSIQLSINRVLQLKGEKIGENIIVIDFHNTAQHE